MVAYYIKILGLYSGKAFMNMEILQTILNNITQSFLFILYAAWRIVSGVASFYPPSGLCW
jgi:hypothetical protein